MNATNNALLNNYNPQKVLRKSLLKNAAETLAGKITDLLNEEKGKFHQANPQSPGGLKELVAVNNYAIPAFQSQLQKTAWELQRAIENELNLPFDETREEKFRLKENNNESADQRFERIANAFRELANQIDGPAFGD